MRCQRGSLLIAVASNGRQPTPSPRSMELELASMDPYLALLPEELRQAVKTELAARSFPGKGP